MFPIFTYADRRVHHGPRPVRRVSAGFTLVELLIALVLGALVIGGVATVFISSQQTHLRLTDYNNAQEAFRFASQTITRVTRGANGITTSSDDSLVLRLLPPDEDGGTNQNCLGQVVTEEQFNRFCISNRNLVCEVSSAAISPNSECPASPVLVRDVAVLEFFYASSGFDSYDTDYQDASEIVNWLGGGAANCEEDGDEGVTGVRVRLGMNEGFEVTFTAAVRQRLIPCDVVIRPGD